MRAAENNSVSCIMCFLLHSYQQVQRATTVSLKFAGKSLRKASHPAHAEPDLEGINLHDSAENIKKKRKKSSHLKRSHQEHTN